MRKQMHCNVLKTIYDVNRETTKVFAESNVIAKKYKMMSGKADAANRFIKEKLQLLSSGT